VSEDSIKRCASAYESKDTTFYECPYTGQQCLVALAFSQKAQEAIGQATHCLPCSFCHGATDKAQKLRGVRLGKWEREILLHAPSYEAKEGLPVGVGESRAEKEAKLRAARKLKEAGLLFTGTRKIEQETARLTARWWRDPETKRIYELHQRKIKRRYAHRTVFLSPLGEGITSLFATELKARKPIRWDGRLQAAAGSARRETDALMKEYAENIQQEASFYTLIMRYGAMHGKTPGPDVMERYIAFTTVREELKILLPQNQGHE
jgi:hypothetical protein